VSKAADTLVTQAAYKVSLTVDQALGYNLPQSIPAIASPFTEQADRVPKFS